jgi:prolipoprotein diacylglyceryltransferase
VWHDPLLDTTSVFQLRGAGVLLLIASAVGFAVSRWAAGRMGLAPSLVADAALWSLPEALLAARLGYVAMHLDAYVLAPWRILAVWDGGFAFGAGLIVGIGAGWAHVRRRAATAGRLADSAVPGILIASGLFALLPNAGGDAVLAVLLLLALAPAFGRVQRPPGALLLVYLALYGFGQVVLAARHEGGVANVATQVSVLGWSVVFLLCTGLLGYHRLRGHGHGDGGPATRQRVGA